MVAVKSPTQRAKDLRKSQTDAEKLLWQQLRNRQIGDVKFRRQYVFGEYIVDFVCIERALIIEIDGSQHLQQIEYDKKRTEYLESQGFSVLRFWNDQVLTELEIVLEVIYSALFNNPSPQPSPLGGERE